VGAVEARGSDAEGNQVPRQQPAERRRQKNVSTESSSQQSGPAPTRAASATAAATARLTELASSGPSLGPRGAGDYSGPDTVLGARTVFEGTIRAEGPLRIQGRIQGEVSSTSSVHIEAGGFAEARIEAAAVEIAGEVQGQVHASGRVVLASTSRVSGEVYAGTIVMSEGAVLDGALHMGAAHARVATDPSP
jgi:cytoskeletal protein CcmA (bactofilin family)